MPKTTTKTAPRKTAKATKATKPPKRAGKTTTRAARTARPRASPRSISTPGAAKTLTLGKTKATVTPAADGTTTLRLVRTIKAPAERIYNAFTDPDAYAKWLPPNGFTGKVHHMEPKVGGTFRMSFNTVGRTWGHTFGGQYQELVPNKRIVHTDRFEDPAMGEGTMTVTIELTPVKGGTRLDITQAGIPKGPAAQGAPYGWSESLQNLATLCEVELPF